MFGIQNSRLRRALRSAGALALSGIIVGFGTAASAAEKSASNNTLTISNETVSETKAGGTTSSGDAKNNTVNVVGSDTKLSGMYLYGGHSGDGAVSGNTINISDGTSSALIHAGDATSGNVTNNTVNVTGGKFTGGWLSGAYISNSGNAIEYIWRRYKCCVYRGKLGVGYAYRQHC